MERASSFGCPGCVCCVCVCVQTYAPKRHLFQKKQLWQGGMPPLRANAQRRDSDVVLILRRDAFLTYTRFGKTRLFRGRSRWFMFVSKKYRLPTLHFAVVRHECFRCLTNSHGYLYPFVRCVSKCCFGCCECCVCRCYSGGRLYCCYTMRRPALCNTF